MNTRAAIKAAAEQSAVLTGAPSLLRRSRGRRGEVLILAYHNVIPDGAAPLGDQSLHLPQAAFGRQLDRLRETHEVVALAELLTGFRAAAARPRVAITFDDAYYGALTAGLDELRRRDLPATVFVAPAYLGGEAFWWDLLTPPGSAELPPAVRDTALTAQRGRQAEVCSAMPHAATPLPIWARCTDIRTLDEALGYARLSLGSHTWSHPNLTRLTDSELALELSAPREWLGQYGDRAAPVISYPYGCADARVWRAAGDAGYTAGFMIDGGWVRGGPANPYAIPRLNIPAGVSDPGFVLRTSGVLSR